MFYLYAAGEDYAPTHSTGYAVHIYNVVKALREKGHRVVVLAFQPDGHPTAVPGDPDVIYVSRRPRNPSAFLRSARSYWSHLRQVNKGAPQLIYCRWTVSQMPAILFAKRHRLPLILEVNGVPDQDMGGLRPWERLFSFACRAADRIVVKADCMGTHFQLRYGLAADKFATVPNGVDCDVYCANESDHREILPDSRPTVGYVGNLARNYDIDLLWRAAPRVVERVPEVRFAVAGTGPREAELRESFARLGLGSHLLLLGGLPYAEAGKLMAECDVLVAPLADTERNQMSSPLKVYHYLAAGVPTVASDIEVMRQFHESGLITHRPGDLDSFADAIIRTLSLPADERSRLGHGGRAFVESRFTWKQTVTMIEHVVVGVVDKNRT